MDADTGNFAYTYDAMNRLAQVQKDGALLRAYSYDAFGNRTRKEDYTGNLLGNVTSNTPIITAYQYNTKNQLISEADGLTEKHY